MAAEEVLYPNRRRRLARWRIGQGIHGIAEMPGLPSRHGTEHVPRGYLGYLLRSPARHPEGRARDGGGPRVARDGGRGLDRWEFDRPGSGSTPHDDTPPATDSERPMARRRVVAPKPLANAVKISLKCGRIPTTKAASIFAFRDGWIPAVQLESRRPESVPREPLSTAGRPRRRRRTTTNDDHHAAGGNLGSQAFFPSRGHYCPFDPPARRPPRGAGRRDSVGRRSRFGPGWASLVSAVASTAWLSFGQGRTRTNAASPGDEGCPRRTGTSSSLPLERPARWSPTIEEASIARGSDWAERADVSVAAIRHPSPSAHNPTSASTPTRAPGQAVPRLNWPDGQRRHRLGAAPCRSAARKPLPSLPPSVPVLGTLQRACSLFNV